MPDRFDADDTHVHAIPVSRVFALLLASLACSSATAEAPRMDDPQVRACIERTLPASDISQHLTVNVFDRTGAAREIKGTLYWKRFDDGLSRVLVRVSAPANSAGLGVLLLERAEQDPDIHMYVPELRRTRRMTSGALSGRLLGTDFSYEDFVHFQQMAKSGTVRRLADATLGDQSAYLLEAIPDDESSDYSRIVTYIDQALCLPLKTEFFGHNGDLHKVLDIERATVREINGRYVPQRAVMFDHNQDSRSVVEVGQIEVDTGLRDTFFSLSELGRGY